MATAVLVDGAFFIKRFRSIEPHNAYDAERAADSVFRWAIAHLSAKSREASGSKRDLYRIFFYDCPPLEKRMHNPVTKRAVDFAKSTEAVFRKQLHECLLRKRKLALRLGHLSSQTGWTIKPAKISELLAGKACFSELTERDVLPSVRQKGVDMRVGLDVASLAYKQQVDQMVLIAGDADFVPAAKLARREGIDFILDPMWQSVPIGLMEHVDGLRSTCPKPVKASVKASNHA